MPLHKGNLAAGFRIQICNIKSLVLREMVMRNGRENIGFGWVLVEPLILTSGVMMVWTLLSDGKSKHDITIIEMVLTGYMPLTLWRHMTNPSVRLFSRSVSLLYHRRITLFDILISKQGLEFIGTSAAFGCVYTMLYVLDLASPVYNLGLLIIGWIMMALLGLASGAILASLTERWESAERFVMPCQYLMVPVSGCFFMVEWVPSWAQQLLLFNPMVHCFEAVRAGYFGSPLIFHYNLGYFFACVFVLLFLGVQCVNKARPWISIN